MPPLGELLVQAGVISNTQLEEAIQNQVIFGGRLGTNLIELGYLDEQTLTKYLSKKHGVPTVDWQALNRIKPSTLKLFTKQLAKMSEAFPLKVEGRDLYVVMSDPGNLEAVQQIGFATGKRVRPLVLPEVRVFDLLTRFYNIGRELRYINLAMMYQVKPKEEPRKPSAKIKPSGISEEQWQERQKVMKAIDFSGDELSSEEDFQRLANEEYQRVSLGADLERDLASQTGAQDPQPEPTPAQPPAPVAAPPPPPAPAAPPAPASTPVAPAAPRAPGGAQPYKDVAQAMYVHLMKNNVTDYIPKATLQEFLKLFVKSQLNNWVLSTSFLANWLVMEADAPVEWLEPLLEEFKRVHGPALGVKVLLPGEKAPEPVAPEPEEEVVEVAPVTPPPAVPAAPAPPAAEPGRKSADDVLAELEAMEVESVSSETAEAYETLEVLELGDEDLATVEEVEAYIPEEAPEEPAPPPEEEYPVLTLAEAKARLAGATDRKDISRTLLGVARNFFKRSLLFTVRGQKLFGWDGLGPGITGNMVEGIMLPLDKPSAFQLANQVQSFTMGPLTPGEINDRFLKTMGGEKPASALIMPIVFNQRVVYIIYGDNGHGQFTPPAPDVQILAYDVAKSLERLIQRKKAEKPAGP